MYHLPWVLWLSICFKITLLCTFVSIANIRPKDAYMRAIRRTYTSMQNARIHACETRVYLGTKSHIWAFKRLVYLRLDDSYIWDQNTRMYLCVYSCNSYCNYKRIYLHAKARIRARFDMGVWDLKIDYDCRRGGGCKPPKRNEPKTHGIIFRALPFPSGRIQFGRRQETVYISISLPAVLVSKQTQTLSKRKLAKRVTSIRRSDSGAPLKGYTM